MIETADPIRLAKKLWPSIDFYQKQQDIIYSVWANDETYVPAGNMLGKDYVAGRIALLFFLSRYPCRIVTTSADYSQLRSVLWGEIRSAIEDSVHPLDSEKGGPLLINDLHIRWLFRGRLCPLSYIIGRVAAKGEGMLGHHIAETGDGIPRTLWIADEASGVEDISYERASTWARRMLVIGNPYPGAPGCSFFKKGVQAGDLVAQ